MRNLLIVLTIVLALLAGAYFVIGFMADKMAEQKVAEFFAGMEDVARAEYGEVHVDMFSMDATINDLEVVVTDGKRFTVDEFVLSRYEEKDGQPVDLAATFKGVHIPVDEQGMGEAAVDLNKMGYQELVLDYAMDYRYEETEKVFNLEELTINVRDAGEITLGLNLENVNLKALMEGGPDALLVAISDARLRYRDRSFLQRLLKLVAEQENQSVEEILATIDEGLDAEMAKVKERKDEFTLKTLQEIKRFVHGRTELSISCDPPEAVGLMYLLAMEDAQEVIQALHLSVESK